MILKKRPAEVVKLCRKNQFNKPKIVFISTISLHSPFEVDHKNIPETHPLGGTFFTYKSLYPREVQNPSRFSSSVFFYFELDFMPYDQSFLPRRWALSPLRSFLTGSPLCLFHYYTTLETFFDFQKHPYNRYQKTVDASVCRELRFSTQKKR